MQSNAGTWEMRRPQRGSRGDGVRGKRTQLGLGLRGDARGLRRGGMRVGLMPNAETRELGEDVTRVLHQWSIGGRIIGLGSRVDEASDRSYDVIAVRRV